MTLNDHDQLKLVAFLPDISGVKVIVQLVNQPQTFLYLIQPNWDVEELVDQDFVTGAILEHGFQPISKEVTFMYKDRVIAMPSLELLLHL